MVKEGAVLPFWNMRLVGMWWCIGTTYRTVSYVVKSPLALLFSRVG